MTGSEPIDRAVEIERLATLEPIDYEAARIDAAKRLGARTQVLDREVARKRRALGLDDAGEDVGQGQVVKLEDPLPWHDPIEGDRIATALAATIRRYVALPDAAPDTISLWVLHTYIAEKFTVSPRLAVTSPTKGCGKSTLLRLLTQLSRRGLKSGSVSPAALFRAIEQLQPTMFLDENDKYLESGSELHALLNEGHCKGATVLRVLGERQELRRFKTFCPVAFARNGRIPDDLEQRSIVIEMQRRRLDEPLEILSEGSCPEQLRTLSRMCARWADDVVDDLVEGDPDMGGLINRDADNWRPLFAIADIIGSDWPLRIREAAAVLAPREIESTGPMLLADIRLVFLDKITDRLPSAEMCEALYAMEGKPWGDWKGKGLTPNQLARLLKPFSIRPDNIRVGSQVPKGYCREQFEAAWRRYLAPDVGYEPLQRYNAHETGTASALQTATEKPDVAFQKSEKASSNGASSVVALQNSPSARSAEDISPHLKVSGPHCDHCGKPGNLRQIAYGEFLGWLHRGCEPAWMADCDLKDIPPYLDRRAELSA
jgi:hypothetical protein